MEFLISIGTKIADCSTVAPIGRHIGFLKSYVDNFQQLKDQVESLNNQKERLMHRVNEARRRAEMIEPTVEDWLNRTDETLGEAMRLCEERYHARWSFLNLKFQHQFSRKAKKIIDMIAELQNRGSFDPIAYPALLYRESFTFDTSGKEELESRNLIEEDIVLALEDPKVNKIGTFDTSGNEELESRNLIKEDIVLALEDPKVNKIGIHGLGGVGKTTLAKEIARHVKEVKLFDAVVMVHASPNLNVEDEIKYQLRLHTEEGLGLFPRTILIILYDIWGIINLGNVEIILKISLGSKLLLISRNQRIWTQKDFRLDVLNERESWNLFQTMVGDSLEDIYMQNIAKEVAKICGGFPLLIKTTAGTLRNKDIACWHDALNQLGSPNTKGMNELIYSCLELSYNQLEDEEVKEVFLLCGILHETSILFSDLLKYVIGLGVFKHIYTIDDARNKLCKVIDRLKASYLLLDDDDSGRMIQMHEILCVVALSIADRDQQLMLKVNRLRDWPNEYHFERLTHLILKCDIKELPERLDCPNLKSFQLGSLIKLTWGTSHSFFEGMRNLEVLYLIGMTISSLPTSLASLTKLKTLCFDQCSLSEMARIGALRNLEILSFIQSSMEEFPSEIGQLTHLRMLDLNACRIKVIPPKILSKLNKLEELYMGKTSIQYKNSASLVELTYMKNLTTLEIQISDAWILKKISVIIMLEQLKRYKIVIGDKWHWRDKNEASRLLQLELDTNFDWGGQNSTAEDSYVDKINGLKTLVSTAEDLYVDQINACGLKTNVLYHMNAEGFPRLMNLHIQNSTVIQHIVNSTEMIQVHVLFPKLETLILDNLQKLEKICHGPLMVDSFQKLKVIKITRCGQLEYLFLSSMVKQFSQLREIEVSECNSMKNIVLWDNGITVDREENEFISLRSLTLQHLSAMDGFYSNEFWTNIPTLFPNAKAALPGSKHLKVINIPRTGHLVMWTLSSYEVVPLHDLKTMEIGECNDLRYLFVVEGVRISEEMRLLPHLRQLRLRKLGSFRGIVGVNHPWRALNFRMLRHITVDSCNQMKYLLPLYILQDLEQLRTVDISDCEMLEQVFGDEDDTQMTTRQSNETVFPLLCSLQLRNLPKLVSLLTGKKEETVTTANAIVFRQVNTLILEDLPELTGFWHDGCMVTWLSLKSVRIVRCPKIGKSMLGAVDRPFSTSVVVSGNPWQNEDHESNIIHLFLTDELSKLENLTIKGSELKKYMEMKLRESSFRQLKTLEASKCDKELNKFLSILLPRSRWLERLKVERCELLEQIFDLKDFHADKEDNPKFPNLNTMILYGLPELKCIWNKDPRGIIELGKLVKLEIIDCGLLKGPLSTALLQNLILLQDLKIDSCKMIEEVVEEDTERQERSFPGLKNLQLVSLPKLINFNSGYCNFRFPNLSSLSIENCPTMNAFTTGFLNNQTPTIEGTSDHVPQDEMMDACPKLQTLKLEGLETFNEIWQGWVSNKSVCELQEVEVDSLSSLRCIFPSNMLRRQENDSIMAFQNLKIVRVKSCGSLQHLLLPSSFLRWEKIEISDCKILEEISVHTEEETYQKISLHLESMVLENLPMLSNFCLETFEFPSLQKLRIVNCPALETLSRKVSDGANDLNMDSVHFLFDITEDSPSSEGMRIPPQLEELELSDLPKMQLWKQEPLIPVFTKLTSLEIICCSSDEKLFSISVAEHLSVLKLLKLYGCENMAQVLQGGGGGNSERVFKNLESLVLKHLPSLTSFCDDDVDFGEFPELKIIRVENVPNMKAFVKRPLKTPKLKEVYVTYITKCWLGDLNKTITYLHKNQEKLKAVWVTYPSSLENSLWCNTGC